jgi:hypothetical protein
VGKVNWKLRGRLLSAMRRLILKFYKQHNATILFQKSTKTMRRTAWFLKTQINIILLLVNHNKERKNILLFSAQVLPALNHTLICVMILAGSENCLREEYSSHPSDSVRGRNATRPHQISLHGQPLSCWGQFINKSGISPTLRYQQIKCPLTSI